MTESKPLASLTPSLLARKGAGKPTEPSSTIGVIRPVEGGQSARGAPVDAGDHRGATMPSVLADRDTLIDRVSKAMANKAAFTLRLDADRHRKLRLACAVNGVSAQQFVTQALDALLEAMPEIERLTLQLPPERSE